MQEDEMKIVRDWLDTPGSYADFSEQIGKINVDKAWDELRRKKQKRRNILPTYLKYAAMVAIVLAISMGGYWWIASDGLPHSSTPELVTASHNHIEPGKNKAILTLHSGEEIELEEEILFAADIAGYAAQTEVASKAETARFSTIETPIGGEYRLTLSDGSVVCLNSQTALRFPDKFAKDKREIELLQGEIYLDVHSLAGNPFFVRSKAMTVRVTGTSFNISTYNNINQTTLVEGAVEVVMNAGKTYRLNPSEQLSFETGSDDARIRQVDTDLYTSWIDGRMVFKDETMESIMNTLSRWYNFEAKYDDPELKKYRFGIHVNKYSNIDPFLAILESTGRLRFEVDGNTIHVKRNGSQ